MSKTQVLDPAEEEVPWESEHGNGPLQREAPTDSRQGPRRMAGAWRVSWVRRVGFCDTGIQWVGGNEKEVWTNFQTPGGSGGANN